MAEKSRTALAGLGSNKIQHPYETEDSKKRPRDVLAKCAICHSAEMHERLGAPQIPFEEGAQKLAAWAKENQNLAQSIENRIKLDWDSSLKMPPNEEISEAEKRTLIQLLH